MRLARIILLRLLLIAAAVILGYWYLVPVPVDHYAVKPRPMTLDIVGPGLVDATNKVAVTAKINGFLLSIEADKNDNVQRGKVLAQLESSDLRNQVVAAQADAEAAKFAITVAQSERDRTIAQLGRAKADFGRKSELVRTNIVSQADLVNSEAAFKEADANYARSTTAIERAKAQSASADATVNVLKTKLNEAIIRAPINGVVISRDRNIGDLLSPGAQLMQIVDPASIIISARFDESTMDAIRPGQRARVLFASDSGSLVEGAVLRVTRLVDRETREYIVDVTLRSLPENWALNQRANVVIEAQSPVPAIAVPKDYITRFEGRPGVWLAQDGRAVWVPVKTGYVAKTDVQITGGLKAGDLVLDPRGRYAYQRVTLTEAQQ